MEWRERIAEGFPPPYRGEPSSLRRDIEDELADHLALATGRELVRTGDEAAARKAAVERFGNPRALARQLWFEAMKERIMKDRIMTVAMCLLAIAAILGGVFAYKAFEQSRQTSQAMIAALEKLAAMKQNETMTATETAMATFKVVDEAGKPVEGVKISLNGRPFTEKEEVIEVATNASGISVFGPVRMGKYKVFLTANGLSTNEEITLYLADNYEETITVPNVPMVKVNPRIDLPTDLLEAPLLFICSFENSFEASDKKNWSIGTKSEFLNKMARKKIAISTSGKVYSLSFYQNAASESGSYIQLYGDNYELKDRQVDVPALQTIDATIDMYYLVDKEVDLQKQICHFRQSMKIEPLDCHVDIEEGGQNGSNDLVISFPKEKVKEISELVVKVRDNDNIELSKDIFSKISGRLVGIRHITKDCWIKNNDSGFSGGAFDCLTLADYYGGSRMLVDWSPAKTEDAEDSQRRYLLAYYVDIKNDRIYEEVQRGGYGGIPPKIVAHRILEDWPEMTSWNTMPKYDEAPLAEYSFDADEHTWAIFDVTPHVEAQGETDKSTFGLMFSFNKEIDDVNEQDSTGYNFFSLEYKVGSLKEFVGKNS